MKNLFLWVMVGLLAIVTVSCNAAKTNNVGEVDENSIAIVGFNAGVDISQSDIDGITSIFNTSFVPRGYTIVERARIDKVIEEQGFQHGKITQTQMVRIGKILNVSKIVVGDVNIVKGQYNIDVRVVGVESGEVLVKDGVALSTNNESYRFMMETLASRLAGKLAVDLAASKSGVRSRSDVDTLLGYLKVYPAELGVFNGNPTTIIEQINHQGMYNQYTWRIPTDEELSLLRANGYLGDGLYMSTETCSLTGIVLLVTDATESYAQAKVRLEKEERIERAENIRREKIYNGKGDNGIYKVGYYYEVGDKKGVVFEVSDGGRHGKIVSLVDWGKRDGSMASVAGWETPTRNELLIIFREKDVINETLFLRGEMLADQFYMSSTVCDRWPYPHWVVDLRDGEVRTENDVALIYARAVSEF